jgi:NAD(P)H dehydrogenase (quinone)
MKYLLIYAHPNPKSFNHALKETIVARIRATGQQVTVRDLYALQFNPVLSGNDFVSFSAGKVPADIATEQAFVKEADVMVVVHPIWWFGMPAILKGYIDRVFSYGFAYEVTDKGVRGLLSDKKVMVFNTTGGPQETYKQYGFTASVENIFNAGIYGFSGMQVINHTFFYGVPTVTQKEREDMLASLTKVEF